MRVRARVRFSHLNFTHRLLRRVSLVFVPLQHVIAKALRCLVLRDVRLCSRFWRRDLRRTSFCGEVAGFLDPSFRFGMIRQHVLEAHDDFGQHTERGMHVLPAAEVLRGKRVELLRVEPSLIEPAKGLAAYPNDPDRPCRFWCAELLLETNQGPKVLESSLARGPLQCQSEHYNTPPRRQAQNGFF